MSNVTNLCFYVKKKFQHNVNVDIKTWVFCIRQITLNMFKKIRVCHPKCKVLILTFTGSFMKYFLGLSSTIIVLFFEKMDLLNLYNFSNGFRNNSLSVLLTL